MQKLTIRIYPFFLLLAFAIWQYSVNDMATSTNAYQAQGNRGMVYVYLVMILGLLAFYCISLKKISVVPCTQPIIWIALWVVFDNIILGNFFNASMWTAFTHSGLTVWWLLAVIFGNHFIKNNEHKEKQLIVFIMLMFVYYSLEFIEVAIESNRTHEQTTVLNLIYRLLVFVPFIFSLKNEKLRNVLLLVVFVLTVVSMKRGAIIVLPIKLIVAFYINNRDDKDTVKKIFIMIGALILAVVAFNIADTVTGGFLSHRFSHEELMNGSSRSDKYSFAFGEISGRGFKEFMLGIGSGKRGGVHNEILEFWYTFGTVGLLMYIWLCISLIRRLIYLVKVRSEHAAKYSMIVVYIIVVGLYSGVYFTHSTFYIMLFVGMIERKIFEESLCRGELE